MPPLQSRRNDNLTIVCRRDSIDPASVLDGLSRPENTLKKGRGEVTLFYAGTDRLVCRKYVHGGLLRALTGEVFYSPKRAARELDVTLYLEEQKFPVVSPYGYIAEKTGLTMSLFFLTFYKEHKSDLFEFLQSAGARERLRAIRGLSTLLFRMGSLGVYHPDLHLRNILVAGDGSLVFLDFDKAERKVVGEKDMANMFQRLDRYVEKQRKAGLLAVTMREKIYFLRVYERLKGGRVSRTMERTLVRGQRVYGLGWLVESLFYGRPKNRE